MTVQDLSRSKWTILYHSYTISTTCKPTVLYYSFVCQEYNQYLCQMFITDQENLRCQYAFTACTHIWILTTVPSASTTTITLICPGETTQFIEVRKPIHILSLPTACIATSLNFHLPPHNEGPTLEVNISLDMANLNMINISSMNFHIWQHLKQHQNESQPTYPQFQ